MAAAVAAVDAMDEVADNPIEGSSAARTEAEAEAAAAVAAVNSLDEDAFEAVPARLRAPEISAAAPPRVVDAPAAGSEVATEAPGGVAGTTAGPGTELAKPEERAAAPPVGGELSEREAELQALREAFAIVTGDEGGSDETEGTESGGAARDVEAAAGPAREAGQTAGTGAAPAVGSAAQTEREMMAAEEPLHDAPASPDAGAEAVAAPRRKGLFRRFRGG